ncbi:jg19099 [Pararge aegeria aegeria]|uniref:Jg19099 protein n=1 Tax=Pararge aegeria aegeria TaxID=348720 RepID=A0A8S4SBH1_9NEOP|nr:jg19099 [Pararge aegeria aegeria]
MIGARDVKLSATCLDLQVIDSILTPTSIVSSAAFGKLCDIFRQKSSKQCVLPVMPYGSETVANYGAQKKAQNHCLRDQIRNEEGSKVLEWHSHTGKRIVGRVDPQPGGQTTSNESRLAAGYKRPRNVECGTPYKIPISSSGRQKIQVRPVFINLRHIGVKPHVPVIAVTTPFWPKLSNPAWHNKMHGGITYPPVERLHRQLNQN